MCAGISRILSKELVPRCCPNVTPQEKAQGQGDPKLLPAVIGYSCPTTGSQLDARNSSQRGLVHAEHLSKPSQAKGKRVKLKASSAQLLRCPVLGCSYPKPFSRRFELRRHVQTLHPYTAGLGSIHFYRCALCSNGYAWLRRDKVLLHIRKAHPGHREEQLIQTYHHRPLISQWNQVGSPQIRELADDTPASSTIGCDSLNEANGRISLRKASLVEGQDQDRGTEWRGQFQGFHDHCKTKPPGCGPSEEIGQSHLGLPIEVAILGGNAPAWPEACEPVDGNDQPSHGNTSGVGFFTSGFGEQSTSSNQGACGAGKGRRQDDDDGNASQSGKRKRPKSTEGVRPFRCVFCHSINRRHDRRDSCWTCYEYVSYLSPHHAKWHDFEYCLRCLRKFGNAIGEVQRHDPRHCTLFRCVTPGCQNYGEFCQPCSGHSRANGQHAIYRYLHILAGITPPESPSISTSSTSLNAELEWTIGFFRRLNRQLWLLVTDRSVRDPNALRGWYNVAMASRIQQTPGSQAEGQTHPRMRAHEVLAEQLWEHRHNVSTRSLADLREMYIATLQEEPPEPTPRVESVTTMSDQGAYGTSVASDPNPAQPVTDLDQLFQVSAWQGANTREEDLLHGIQPTSSTSDQFDRSLSNVNSTGVQNSLHGPGLVSNIRAFERNLGSMNTGPRFTRAFNQANNFGPGLQMQQVTGGSAANSYQEDIDSWLDLDFTSQNSGGV